MTTNANLPAMPSTPYDNWRCIDPTADQAAKEALHAELVRQQVVITPQELGEHLAALEQAQFDQVMQLVLETSDEQLRYMVREVVCGKLLDKRVKEMMK
jgi:hypothetical protein